jgi:chloride channel 3/4/5
MSRDAKVIRLDQENTVKSLRDQLFTLTASGNDDSGFPILRAENSHGGYRMLGYIGANELEHALSKLHAMFSASDYWTTIAGIAADEVEDEVLFHANYSRGILTSSVSTLSSLEDNGTRHAGACYDFSAYMDQVSSNCKISACRLKHALGTTDCSIKLSVGDDSSVLRQTRCKVCCCD